VHRQTLVFLLFTNLFVGLAPAQPNDSNAVNCTQFMAWTAGGVSSQRLARLVQQRGISFLLDAPTLQLLLKAGAEPPCCRAYIPSTWAQPTLTRVRWVPRIVPRPWPMWGN
jgi:hypothetical protein